MGRKDQCNAMLNTPEVALRLHSQGRSDVGLSFWLRKAWVGFKLDDADDFFVWASNPKVTRYLRWGPLNSPEEALKNIQEIAIPHPWRRSICLEDRNIGYISIRLESGVDKHRAHVGYALGIDYWGKGIATFALKLAVSAVFQEFIDLVRLEALVEEENIGSQRVLEKAGFKKEGLLRKYGFNKGEIRNMFMYSFLSTHEIGSVQEEEDDINMVKN